MMEMSLMWWSPSSLMAPQKKKSVSFQEMGVQAHRKRTQNLAFKERENNYWMYVVTMHPFVPKVYFDLAFKKTTGQEGDICALLQYMKCVIPYIESKDHLELVRDIEYSPLYRLMLSDDVDETFTDDCLYEILVEAYGGDYHYHKKQKEKFDEKYKFVLK